MYSSISFQLIFVARRRKLKILKIDMHDLFLNRWQFLKTKRVVFSLGLPLNDSPFAVSCLFFVLKVQLLVQLADVDVLPLDSLDCVLVFALAVLELLQNAVVVQLRHLSFMILQFYYLTFCLY